MSCPPLIITQYESFQIPPQVHPDHVANMDNIYSGEREGERAREGGRGREGGREGGREEGREGEGHYYTMTNNHIFYVPF